MSANVESMYYVNEDGSSRNVPWHGLGVSVEQAPTSADAIRLAGLDWKVNSMPIFANNQEIPGYRANIRETDGKCLGIVGNRYQIIQNKDAFDFTDALIGEGAKYETAGSLDGGKRIWMLARLPETKILDDKVIPYLCFSNGHDGYYTIKACMTPVRVVCQNTLNFALDHAPRSWATRHVGDLTSKLDEARHTLELANNYMTELAITADKLANTDVSEDEVRAILDNVYPVKEDDSDRRKANVEEVKNQFMVCMLAPDILKFKGSAYQVAQAAADFVDHVAPKRKADNYQEKNFGRILDGHVVLDKVFAHLMQKVATGKLITSSTR